MHAHATKYKHTGITECWMCTSNLEGLLAVYFKRFWNERLGQSLWRHAVGAVMSIWLVCMYIYRQRPTDQIIQETSADSSALFILRLPSKKGQLHVTRFLKLCSMVFLFFINNKVIYPMLFIPNSHPPPPPVPPFFIAQLSLSPLSQPYILCLAIILFFITLL